MILKYNKKYVRNNEYLKDIATETKLIEIFDIIINHANQIPKKNSLFIYSNELQYSLQTRDIAVYTINIDFKENSSQLDNQSPLLSYLSSSKSNKKLNKIYIDDENKIEQYNYIAIQYKDSIILFYDRIKNICFAVDFTHCKNKFAYFMCDFLINKIKCKRIDADERINIKLGCDPEFEIIKSNGVIGEAYDFVVDEDHNKKIGLDGNSSICELRPSPSKNVKILIKNIKELLKKVNMEFKIGVNVSSCNYPTGFHIHFSAPYCKDFIKILDNYVGVLFKSINAREHSQYANLGAYEIKKYGFEYRSLPAYIMYTPELLYIIFKLCKNLAENFYNYSGVKLPPTEYEYEKYINKNEIKYLFSMAKNLSENLKSSIDDINKYWLKSEYQQIIKYRLKIVFNDDWNTDIYHTIIDYIEKINDCVKFNENQKIVFGGLKESRGLVYHAPFHLKTLDEYKIQKIDIPELKSDVIYLPFALREKNINFWKFNTIALIREILTNLKKINKKKEVM